MVTEAKYIAGGDIRRRVPPSSRTRKKHGTLVVVRAKNFERLMNHPQCAGARLKHGARQSTLLNTTTLLLALVAMLSFATTTQAQGGAGLSAPRGAVSQAPPPDAEIPEAPVDVGVVYERSEAPTDGNISLSEATRLRALDNSLSSLAARGSSVFGGVATIAAGVASVGLGGFFHRRDNHSLARYLYLWGTAGAARGIVEIALRPKVGDDELMFEHMPMRTRAEVEARLEFGEAALYRAARRARIARMLDGGIAVVSGLLVIPVYFVPNNFSFDDTLSYFALLGGALNVITGSISFISRSRAERRWSAYEDLSRRLEAGQDVQLGLAPARGGFVASGTWSF